MPLLYLLLCRDFDIFRLCQTVAVHEDELWDSTDTITWILIAVNLRHNDLEGEGISPSRFVNCKVIGFR